MTIPTNEEMRSLAKAVFEDDSRMSAVGFYAAAKSWVPWALSEISYAEISICNLDAKLNSEIHGLRAENAKLRALIKEAEFEGVRVYDPYESSCGFCPWCVSIGDDDERVMAGHHHNKCPVLEYVTEAT